MFKISDKNWVQQWFKRGVGSEAGACVWFKHDLSWRDFKLRESTKHINKLTAWPNLPPRNKTHNKEPNINEPNATVASHDWFENHNYSRINYSIIFDYFKTPTRKNKTPIENFIDSIVVLSNKDGATNQSKAVIPLATIFLVHSTYMAPLLMVAASAAIVVYKSYRSGLVAVFSLCFRHNSVRPLNNESLRRSSSALSPINYDTLRPGRSAWEPTPPSPRASRYFKAGKGFKQKQPGNTNSIIITDL